MAEVLGFESLQWMTFFIVIFNMVKHTLKADSELASSQPDVSPPSEMLTSQQHFYDRVLLFPTLCNPKEYEPWKRYFFTGIVSLAAVAAPLQSNILLREFSSIYSISKALSLNVTDKNPSKQPRCRKSPLTSKSPDHW